MNLIRLILRKSHKITLLAAMASIGAGLATTVLMAFINRVLAQKQAPPHDGLIYFGICLFSIILTAVSQILLIRVAQRGTLELRMDLNRRILNTPLRQLEETGPGRLLAALTEHVGEIAQAITVVPVLSTNLTIVFCCIAYLFWLSWVSMISIVAFVVIGIAGFQLIALIATESLKIAHKDQDTLVGHFRSVVNGIKELKLHRRRREEFVSRALEGTELSLLRNRQKALTLFTLGNVYASSLLYLTLGLFLFVLPALLPLSWTQTLSSIMVMMFFMGPLGAVVGLLPVFSRANTALKKFESLGMSLVDVPPGDAVSGQPLQERRDSWSRLDLEGIAHTYYSDDHAFTLGPISLSFGPREIVFVVGGNGSGKTTLAKLLV
ncbi:MAG TPA: ABC transporter transmembrane domain-containing protein, partial [Verrucomicrobiae bacterium]|nr:ABC transporter transmembrane domain-containing protein [Verrucomicrobiae bacterium]